MKKFRILCIDGGGLRGVVPLTILKQVEAITGHRLHECFDMVAGTSTGGLIACATTLKDPDPNKAGQPLYTLDAIMELYLNRGKEIFPERNGLEDFIEGIADLFHPRFAAGGIQKVFGDTLKEARLADSLTHLLISTYDLTNNAPLLFKTRVARQNPLQNPKMYDVCRATSAGPTYLPAYKFYYPNDQELPDRLCVDGGVYINNPSLGALAELSKHLDEYLPGVSDDEMYKSVHLLSIGTGSYSGTITAAQAEKRGELFWAQNISDIMMRGVNQVTDYQMTEMMVPGNYLRLSIDIKEAKYADMSLSDPETAHYLIKQTNEQVLNNQQKMADLKTFLSKIC